MVSVHLLFVRHREPSTANWQPRRYDHGDGQITFESAKLQSHADKGAVCRFPEMSQVRQSYPNLSRNPTKDSLYPDIFKVNLWHRI